MSKIYVDEIAGIASPSTVAIPGHVIQVVQTVKTDSEAYSLSSTWSDITGLSASITPTSVSSKILIEVCLYVGENSSSNGYPKVRLTKNGSVITAATGDSGYGDRVRASAGGGWGGGNTAYIHSFAIKYLDSPSTTSATSYTVQLEGYAGRSLKVNGTGTSDANSGTTTMSTITLMEIAG